MCSVGGGGGGGGGGCGVFFFFNDTATTEIYTLSLHDALPILVCYLTLAFSAQTKCSFIIVMVVIQLLSVGCTFMLPFRVSNAVAGFCLQLSEL